jgi:DNA-3-methyladenine glycosylase I
VDQDRPRCWWARDETVGDPLMVAYHDDEWGVAVHDDVALFERLVLESFQAGLSWSTILHRRVAFRDAFGGFVPGRVAAFGDADRARLLADARIVRNRAKIDAAIANAQATIRIADQHGSFDAYLASMMPGPPRRLPPNATGRDVPSNTPESDRLAADLRARGFRFVGTTVAYAFLQSVGLVDDHLPQCWRYAG